MSLAVLLEIYTTDKTNFIAPSISRVNILKMRSFQYLANKVKYGKIMENKLAQKIKHGTYSPIYKM